MNIVLTGSLGNVNKPLAMELIEKGHSVTVISSKADRQPAIEALGAKPAIGSITDTDFLIRTMTGADAVFCMNPSDFTATDQIAYYESIGRSYKEAIEQSGVKRVVYMSSYGAHLPSGTGFISGSYASEQILNAVPNILLTHVRPTSFYYNLFAFINMIKTAGFIGAVYGGEDKLAMVSPKDIAAAVAEELVVASNPDKIRYVCSDDRTCNEIAGVLGKAIELPDLKWIALPEEQVMQSLLDNGLPQNAAANLVELGSAIHTGILREDYDLHRPVLGKVKLEDFAKEFAAVYHQQ